MATSKSVPFLIIAGLILATAVAWKLFTNNETVVQPQNKSTASQAEPEAKPVKQVQQNTAITVKNYAEPVEAVTPLSEEEREEKKVESINFMKFSMKYPNANKALAALKTFQDNGNEEMAIHLINYINKSFPNTEIPPELLD